jgi:hypothetical protein
LPTGYDVGDAAVTKSATASPTSNAAATPQVLPSPIALEKGPAKSGEANCPRKIAEVSMPAAAPQRDAGALRISQFA